MAKYKVDKIRTRKGRKISDREVIATLNNGTTIHITSCFESWEQWGGTTDELYATAPIADHYNEWLHGGDLPDFPFPNEDEEDE
jgi:hypothetical protein